MSTTLSISNETKAIVPGALFRAVRAAALGPRYRLSVVVASPAAMKKLNLIYRGINKPTDILSFPISKTEGEMFLCPAEARKEAKRFDRTAKNFLVFLFIHGCVHLKGYEHSATMESIEVKLREKFRV